MSRLIVLDSGPLGMVTNPKAGGLPFECQLWLKSLLQRGEKVVIPEIADYEVRRELLRAGVRIQPCGGCAPRCAGGTATAERFRGGEGGETPFWGQGPQTPMNPYVRVCPRVYVVLTP